MAILWHILFRWQVGNGANVNVHLKSRMVREEAAEIRKSGALVGLLVAFRGWKKAPSNPSPRNTYAIPLPG
jgi:hypothetical protein